MTLSHIDAPVIIHFNMITGFTIVMLTFLIDISWLCNDVQVVFSMSRQLLTCICYRTQQNVMCQA